MLDANIVIYAINGRMPRVAETIMKYEKEELCISVIAYAEIRFGVAKSKWGERNLVNLEKVLRGVDIISWGTEVSEEYGDIRWELERKGKKIGSNDMLIAAHARSLGVTLVTHNTREFGRVEGLRVEDWV